MEPRLRTQKSPRNVGTCERLPTVRRREREHRTFRGQTRRQALSPVVCVRPSWAPTDEV